MASKLWPRTFREIVCSAWQIPPEAYVSQVFKRSLYWHARPLAWFICRMRPDFFEEDFSLIRELGDLRDPGIFRNELNYFFGRNRRDKRWLRSGLAIRVSARKLIRLKNKALLRG